MKNKMKYSIGDMSRICNISKKALRYYDELGLITSKRQDYNNYRYYTEESLLLVPVIKYYKQMGFTLDEMPAFIEGSAPDVYRSIRNSFLAKIAALEKEQQELHKKYISVKDWHDLIVEAEMVIDNNIREVSVKYVEPAELFYLEQDFDGNLKAAIINIEFTNHVEARSNEITGPVLLHFASFRDRMTDTPQRVQIMQKPLKPCADEEKARFGGRMMATCYHIGPHESLGATYEKLLSWIERHGYTPADDAYERYVADYWTTRNSAQFVTEVMVGVSRGKVDAL